MRILLPLFILIPLFSLGQNWESAVLIDQSGNRRVGEVKWRKNIVVDELKFRSEKGKCRIPVDSLTKVDLGATVYESIRLDQIKNAPHVLALKIHDGLYRGYFKEIFCLCDNSYDFVEAYFLESGNEWLIIRKRSILDRIKPDEIALNLLGDAVDELNFSDLPEFLMENGKLE